MHFSIEEIKMKTNLTLSRMILFSDDWNFSFCVCVFLSFTKRNHFSNSFKIANRFNSIIHAFVCAKKNGDLNFSYKEYHRRRQVTFDFMCFRNYFSIELLHLSKNKFSNELEKKN